MFFGWIKGFCNPLEKWRKKQKSRSEGKRRAEGERQAAFFPNSGGRSFCSFWQLPPLLPYLLPLLGNARTASISERVAKKGRTLSI